MWSVPHTISDAFPSLQQKLDLVTIPLSQKEDKLIWKKSHDGDLTFKEAYLFHKNNSQNITWAKLIWNKAIPPSKSQLMWRILLDKMPTDDQLIKRGCSFPSICSLCTLSSESSFHLFMECNFAVQIWNWLSGVFNCNINLSSFSDTLQVINNAASSQCKLVMLSAIIHSFHIVWYCRNQKRYSDKTINVRSAINLIIAGTSMSGNVTPLTASSAISDFTILKHFNVNIKPPKPQIIKEVIWNPPVLNWTKCNTDGAALGNPGLAACGGLFRNSSSVFIGGFAVNLGITTALCSELIAAMLAIEIAHKKGYLSLWLETDSKLVFLAFKSSKIIPWHLQNRWSNCIHLISSMNFHVSHIYREGNKCADHLANLGLSTASHAWFTHPPSIIMADLVSNQLGLPNFRIS